MFATMLFVLALVPQSNPQPHRPLSAPVISAPCVKGPALSAKYCFSAAVAWAGYYIASGRCLATGDERACEEAYQAYRIAVAVQAACDAGYV